MILSHSGDFLNGCHCLDVEEVVIILIASPAIGTHQKRGRLLKNVDESTKSYVPHILP